MDPLVEIDPAQAAALVYLRARVMRYAITLVTLLVSYITPHPRAPAQPLHTSILTGQAWVTELIFGHPNRIYHSLGVRKEVFLELVLIMREYGVTDSRWVSVEEQLAIYLHASVTGLTVRHLAERFQRSNSTISLYVQVS